MAIDRRGVVTGGLVTLVAGTLPTAWGAAAAAIGPVYASACRRKTGGYVLALLDEQGRVERQIQLPWRAHDVAWSAANGWAVLFARQPGSHALAFSPRGERQPTLFTPPDNRCFFGHGAFSPDGRLLYATENDIEAGRGLLGIYDVEAGFARVGEMETGGIGPHEVILLRDGRTLAVANGGYETLPATGRTAIDLAGMRPSLAFLDRLAGTVFATHQPAPAGRMLSIRHLAEDFQGRVWFGAQWEGDADATPELIGRATRDGSLTMIEPVVPLGPALKGYVASVSASRDGRRIAASAPRAGRVVMVDAETGAVSATMQAPDASGVAPRWSQGFAVSTGFGRLLEWRGETPPLVVADAAGLSFDNHMRCLAV